MDFTALLGVCDKIVGEEVPVLIPWGKYMVSIFSLRQYGERVERLVSLFSELLVKKPTKVALSARINWMRSERPRYRDSLICDLGINAAFP